MAATRLRVEGQIHELVLERCVTGPILTAGAGRLGRLLVNDSVVQAADAPATPAISLIDGDVSLTRCTLMGGAELHRLTADESILDGPVSVDDTQRGCVRFSAWTAGSVLPRRYRSVEIPESVALFGSRHFGRPDYGQLLSTVPPAIRAGAEAGSEMGAFAREQHAVKERSLLLKYQEYLPLGLEPVVVFIT